MIVYNKRAKNNILHKIIKVDDKNLILLKNTIKNKYILKFKMRAWEPLTSLSITHEVQLAQYSSTT